MGQVPEPPTGSPTPCTDSGGGSAALHYTSCPTNVVAVRTAEARRVCSNSGHDWTIVRSVGDDRPWQVYCERCGKTLVMVEADESP